MKNKIIDSFFLSEERIPAKMKTIKIHFSTYFLGRY